MKHSLIEKDAHQYQPYKGISQLTNSFAQWYKNHFNVQFVPSEEILPLIGSKEGIMHISMTFLNQGDEVLVPNPGYPAYSMATKLAGGRVIEFDLKPELNFLPNLSEIETLDLTKVKLMWINYPNMPTGGNADLDFYEKLIAFAKKYNILICHDNPYTFILNDNLCNIFQINGAKDHALELTSLSKNYNMAGWRIGAIAGNKHYIAEILKFKSNMDSGMFKPIQHAAVKALSLDKDWFQYLNRIYLDRKVKAIEILKTLTCKINDKSAGMFVYGLVSEKFSSAEDLSEILLHEANVFITPGHIFGSNGKNYLRISLCGSLDLFEEALSRIRSLKIVK
jgi:aspartate/methionine/tyrosine aminotransferase